jgi:hypothetical protein
LKKANLKILTNNECQQKVERITGELLDIPENMLCTASSPYVLLKEVSKIFLFIDTSLF